MPAAIEFSEKRPRQRVKTSGPTRHSPARMLSCKPERRRVAAAGEDPDLHVPSVKKRARLQLLGAGHIPGDDLLSQDLSSHYHWRCSVSLPGSEWDRVVPPRSGHQRAIPFDRDWDSGDLSLASFRPLSGIHTEISNFLT